MKRKMKIIYMAALIAISVSVLLYFVFPFTMSSTISSSAWDGVVATSFTSGTGTNENPYIISNAGEFAYLKSLLESDDAHIYSDKVYKLASSFNYGEYDISINNIVPFSGTIDGNGKTISNATITGSIFNELDNATIKNIALKSINYNLDSSEGAILANSAKDTNINLLIVTGNVNVNEDGNFGGIIYSANNTNYDKIVLDYDINSTSEDTYKLSHDITESTGNNILAKSDNYNILPSDSTIDVDYYEVINNKVVLASKTDMNDYKSDNHYIRILNSEFIFNGENVSTPKRSPIKLASVTPHVSGVDGTTVYINDFTADYDYLHGLNYTEVKGRTLPSQASTGYYDDENLVKVQIIYDGADINNSSLVGAMSPINNENTNKFVYYKYYALERNSNGTLATDSNGNHYIKIELIDNPFSKRPYVNNVEYAFNGWVCNPNVDTDSGLCESSTIQFNKANYTRFIIIPTEGNNELTVHLNASWYVANVATTAEDIYRFNSMSMQNTIYTTYTYEQATGYARWNKTYYTMRANGTVNNGSRISRGNYYKNSQTGSVYFYASSNINCSAGNNNVCYLYTPVNNVITNNSEYTGGSVEIIPSYASNRTQTTVTITSHDPKYMNFVADPNGSYTGDIAIPHEHSYLDNTDTAAGFFYKVSNPTANMINTGTYYTSDGSLCTSASSCTTAYKLIQYNDSTLNTHGNSIYNLEEVNGSIVDIDRYYYLVTRDTNIFRYTSSTSLAVSNLQVNVPYTVTGVEVNGNSITGILNISSNLTLSNDLVIENIKFTGATNTTLAEFKNVTNSHGNSIYAADHNLKVGRNISNSSGFTTMAVSTIYGHTTSTNGNFRIIIESGYYSAFAGTSSTSKTFNETVILGSDYDRVTDSQTNLVMRIGYLGGAASGNYEAGSASPFVVFVTAKSGTFGYYYSNNNLVKTHSLESGIYVNAKRKYFVDPVGAKVEGGNVNVIYGGSGFKGTATNNGIYIGVSGGSVNQIYGGSTSTAVGGNRIVNMSGGIMHGSIIGGSNCVTCSSGGEITASTIVYVGGTAVVGSSTATSPIGEVESGSVFGSGGGNSNGKTASVYNSHVIINGGTIYGSVYGGGNYGGVGVNSNANTHTLVEILDGTIMTGVYGGSKAANFGHTNHASGSDITVNMYGGNVSNLYGGSDTSGKIYGSVDVNMYGGNITGSLYGGGQGSGTFAARDVDVVIGSNSINTTPIIAGNVYGGSAFGTVNSDSTNGNVNGNTTVTINKGTITGSVFGGGEGSQSYTPYVLGNINVTINNGDITSVYGGNDQAGSHNSYNQVNLNGGTIDSVFGGGYHSSVNNTHINLQGSSVTTIYGGSNTSGTVNMANVSLYSGNVGTVYGGNNVGGTANTTNVTVAGSATITGSIYGGGNQVSTGTTNVNVSSANGQISAVYGGGNSASVTTANVTQNGATVGVLFGGSNSSGTVQTSTINHYSGTTTYIYGGNNAGGSTLSSTINYGYGTTNSLFGGGNNATHGNSTINLTNGNVTNVYGGGNNEGASSTTVNVGNNNTNYLNVTKVYGGSNASGIVQSTSVVVNGGTIETVYGGNNLGGSTNAASVTVNNGTITSIYGGGNQAGVNGNITITYNGGTTTDLFGAGNQADTTGNVTTSILGGIINDTVYGGGNEGEVYGNTTVTLKNTTITAKAFAGGNGAQAIVRGNTTINVGANAVVGNNNSTGLNGSVFGSGNQAPTGRETTDNSVATVNITGGNIYGNVYGGANTSVVYGTVNLNVGTNTISNQTLVNTLGSSNIIIHGTIFGGGESNAEGSETFDYDAISVTQGISIKIDGTGYNTFDIYGSIFGSGNASNTPADKPSSILIKNYGSINNPHTNQSIQRVKNLVIDNSSIELSGVRDSTDDYHPTELFSLNRIEQLILKNNSSLFLRKGVNYLEEFNSQDASGNKAYVNIQSDGTITKNTDNRLYVLEGGHVNVAHDGSATDYANVYGMTFFGMYTVSASGHVNMKMFDPSIQNGDIIDWADAPVLGSYVLGKHETNHDTTVDGFYSHFYDNTTMVNSIEYIEPTPSSSPYYYWMIGENVTEYSINLVASKYSTLGTIELSLRGLEAANTSFQILGFDYSGLLDGINLVDRSSIRGLASTEAIANTTFGLAMESSNTGFLTTGSTSYYNSENQPILGTTYYAGDNTNDAPSFLFYLYHYKNLSETMELGKVVIQMMAITQLDDINSELNRLIITVDLSTAVYNTIEYEGAMTPGKKYDLFTSTTTKITDKSSFSAYYSLYSSDSNLYRNGYKHVLTSNYVFPENTKLTLIDLSFNDPVYYYYIVTAADVEAYNSELQTYHEVTYPLSKFIMMDTVGNNNYDNSTMNDLYYTAQYGSFEEFIIQVDFADAEIASNQLNKYLYPELQDANGNMLISALAIERPNLQFSLYVDKDAVISVSADLDDTLYDGNASLIEVESTFASTSVMSDIVYDTTYYDDNLGLLIYLTTTRKDENNNDVTEIVSGNALLGSYFSINGQNYYPEATGLTRLKFADRVGNIKSYITFNLTNAMIPTGSYDLNIEMFGSNDGIHYSNEVGKSSSKIVIPVNIVLSGYGLKATLDDSSIVFVNDGEDKAISGNVQYDSVLNNPNIRLKMYRREYDLVHTTEYEEVDLQDYALDTLVETRTPYSYLLIQNPRLSNNFSVNLKTSGLLTGTYRLDFELYDNNTLIGKQPLYIVIKNEHYSD